MPGPPTVRALEDELRRRFKEAGYLDRTLSGEFAVIPFGRQAVYQNNPDGPQEPEGTISGLVEIVDPSNGVRVALAHRLLRPDGTLGASGLYDPKIVFVGGTIYLQMRKTERIARGLLQPERG